MSKKKKDKFTFADLEPEAREFIRKRVLRLGSVEAVRREYRLGDLVGRYALSLAENLILTDRRES